MAPHRDQWPFGTMPKWSLGAMAGSDHVRHDHDVSADTPHLKLVPQAPDASLVREAFHELHELAIPATEPPKQYVRDTRRWHPSMGARLAAVR
jgi:hypothetical protein